MSDYKAELEAVKATSAALERMVYSKLDELQKVKAERNALARWKQKQVAAREPIGYWEDRCLEAECERDALAAHVERARFFSEQIELADNQSEFNQSANRLCRHLDEAPTTSLARLIAEKQADAVAVYASRYLGGNEQDLAEAYASHLRRQAEEAS